MRNLDLSRDAIKYLRTLDPKPHKQVTSKIFSLMADPRPTDSILLKGEATEYRADCGEHRIIYRFDDKTVFVVTVGRRNDGDAYKQHDRKNR